MPTFPVDACFGRFPLSRRAHADEVPLDFQKVLERTAAPKGCGPVELRKPKQKLEHRVASLMLHFVADGREGAPLPAICFPLVPSVDSEGVVEPRFPAGVATRKQFDMLKRQFPDILIYAQRNGYFDSVTCQAWLTDTMKGLPISGPYLLCLDNLRGHCTPEFREAAACRKPPVELVYTPADCTDACAVTDCGLGRTIKNRMRKKFLADFESRIEAWQGCPEEMLSAADRRHLYCAWLDESFSDFYLGGRWT